MPVSFKRSGDVLLTEAGIRYATDQRVDPYKLSRLFARTFPIEQLRQLCPLNTGRLRSSLRVVAVGPEVHLRGVFYALFDPNREQVVRAWTMVVINHLRTLGFIR